MQAAFHDYLGGDTTCEAFVAYDPVIAGRRPCVLVAHAWGGQGQVEQDKARELARQGYVGIAIDVYGKGVRGDPFVGNEKLMQPFIDDRAMLRRRLLAALAFARSLPMVDAQRIAAMGYCFGGLCVLDLARAGTTDVRGVVSIHGVFYPPKLGPQPPIAAKVLVLHGWDDPFAPPDHVLGLAKELTDAKADWQLHAYGHAKHAFSAKGAALHDIGIVYDEAADRRSGQAIASFFHEVFA